MKSKRIIMIISLALMLVINILAEALPINGVTSREISDQFPVFFVPASYVFSIWILIYLALFAFCVYSMTPQGLADKKIDGITWWFVASCLFNASWLFLWHYFQFTLTLIPVFGLFISLFIIYLKLQIGVERRSFAQMLLINVPYGLYLGWATVTVVANVAQVLYILGWNDVSMNAQIWVVLMIWVSSLMGMSTIYTRREVAFPLVLVWAFIGIWVKNKDTPIVANMALTMAIVLVIFIFGRFIFVKRR